MKYVIAPVLLLAALAFGQKWIVEQVDSTAASASPVELVKAADGRLWAGYVTRSGFARVACLGGSGWSFTDVCSSAVLYPADFFRSFLAASPHGELCLACYVTSVHSNCFYRMVGDSWCSEPNPFDDSAPCNTVAYDTCGWLYTVFMSNAVGVSFCVGHENDTGWTDSLAVQLPAYGYNQMPPVGYLAAAADGSPWFFGFCGWWDHSKADFETDLLHFSGDSWVSVWDVHSYSYADITPVPIALVPHGDGVGNLTYHNSSILYDSEFVAGQGGMPVAGLAYTPEDVPVVAWVSRDSAYPPMFAFRTNRWHSEQIPSPSGAAGLDIEVDTSRQVVIVYSTPDSGLWCATGTDVVGAKESFKPQATSRKLEPTVIRSLPQGAMAFDAIGRRVMDPKSGIYFVRDEGLGAGDAGWTRKVVLQR